MKQKIYLLLILQLLVLGCKDLNSPGIPRSRTTGNPLGPGTPPTTSQNSDDPSAGGLSLFPSDFRAGNQGSPNLPKPR